MLLLCKRLWKDGSKKAVKQANAMPCASLLSSAYSWAMQLLRYSLH